MEIWYKITSEDNALLHSLAHYTVCFKSGVHLKYLNIILIRLPRIWEYWHRHSWKFLKHEPMNRPAGTYKSNLPLCDLVRLTDWLGKPLTCPTAWLNLLTNWPTPCQTKTPRRRLLTRAWSQHCSQWTCQHDTDTSGFSYSPWNTVGKAAVN